MRSGIFSDPAHPAQNIVELLEHLLREHDEQYVYRGQHKVWPSPLWPSAYRISRKTGRIFTPESAEYQHSMRNVGKRFFEIQRFQGFDDLLSALMGTDVVCEEEAGILNELIHNNSTAELLAKESFESVLQKVLKGQYFDKYKHKFQKWENIVLRQHRNLIRLNGFNQLLGFRVGQIIGQQYIESAEFLDVTKSPQIASFFATRVGAGFIPVRSAKSRDGSNDLGIIYRFDVGPFARASDNDFDYFSAPPYVDAGKIISSLEVPTNMRTSWSPANFVFTYLDTDGHRDWSHLKAPKGTVDTSRIGRQKAGFLIPDEIHIELRDKTGHQSVSFQAVEDLEYRPGTEKFYFIHDQGATREIGIETTDLWPLTSPGEETLCELVSCVIFSWQIYKCRLDQMRPLVTNLVYQDPSLWIPPRPDLVRFVS